MRHRRYLLAVALFAAPLGALGQFDAMRAELEAKHEAAHQKLRAATVALRDIRLRSCSAGQTRDCELAKLTDVEIVLLDIEWKYRRGGDGSGERVAKARELSRDARSVVSDLIDALKD
jgi:hypothetical protein